MVHHQFHALGMGIVVEVFDVEIGIGSHKVEDIGLPHIGPVFPTHVPSFHQHLLQTVGRGKVDVLLHLGCVGGMAAVGLRLGPVYEVELDGGIFIGVVPSALAHDHLPPHAAILRGVNPTRVLYLARLVEIENEVARKHVTGIVAHHHRAPRRGAGCLHTSLEAGGIGSEPRLKHHVLVVEVEVHGGIVDTGSLMDVDVEAVAALHL